VTRPAHILLVDDEISIQRAMAPLLRSRGYDVSVAGTGREALDVFTRERPDLLVLACRTWMAWKSA
jgi:DNA-binding response OmpR family regulator